MSLTDEKGNYSIKYNRFGSPVCVFVLPNLEKNSVMYDEFSRQDISWTGNSFLVSVMNEPSVSKRERKGLSLTPFTRFGRALRNSKT
ncbi:MAG: hypothetical protein N3A69_09205 [Leptospiraceae bacterium]|nr:hypothetical protein [Leptospiraceae bacterium]